MVDILKDTYKDSESYAQLEQHASEIAHKVRERGYVQTVRTYINSITSITDVDNTLADIFFLLSEVKSVPKELSDLCLDISLQLRNDEHIMFTSKDAIVKAFQNIVNKSPRATA